MIRRLAVVEDRGAWNRAPHPDARKPLAAFQSITVRCDDCGRTTLLDRDALAEMPAVETFGELWKHAYCSSCRTAGAKTANVVLYGQPWSETAAPAQ